MEQSNPTGVPASVNPILARIQQLEDQLRRQRTQGAVLLGRWFRERWLVEHQEFRARMDVALRDSLKRPRDRRLFGLPTEGGRPLRSESAEVELMSVRAELDALRRREDELSRAVRAARRKEDEARLILEGEVIKRWRDKDPAFAKQLAADIALYFKHASEFTVVEMSVPENWQPAPRELLAAAGSAGSAKVDPSEKQVHPAAAAVMKPEAAQTASAQKHEPPDPQKLASKPNAGLPIPAPLLVRSQPSASLASASPQGRVTTNQAARRATEGG